MRNKGNHEEVERKLEGGHPEQEAGVKEEPMHRFGGSEGGHPDLHTTTRKDSHRKEQGSWKVGHPENPELEGGVDK